MKNFWANTRNLGKGGILMGFYAQFEAKMITNDKVNIGKYRIYGPNITLHFNPFKTVENGYYLNNCIITAYQLNNS